MPAQQQSPLMTPSRWLIAALTGAYVCLAAPGAWLTDNREFLLYIVVLLAVIAVVVGVHLRTRLSTGVLACLSLWGLLHLAGGLLPVPAAWPIDGQVHVLYSLWLIPGWLKYDQLVHAFGFGVATWVCWQGLRAAAGIQRPTAGVLFLVGLAGMGFGALNEVVEFVATLIVPETNVGGYVNTGWDLVANTIGAATAACIIGIFHLFHRRSPPADAMR